MLQSPTQRSYEYPKVALSEERGTNEYFDIGYIVKVVRRQLKLILALAFIGGIFGIVHVATSVRLYTTTVSLLIDRRQVRAVQDVSATTDIGVATPAVVDSQVQIIKSPRIALAVVDRLNLADDPIFWTRDGSLWTDIYRSLERSVRFLTDLVLSSPESVQDEARQQEIRRLSTALRLLGRITPARVGQTYVVTVTYEGTDPAQAVRILNTYVEAYLADQNEAGIEATRRASSWLQDRLSELRRLSASSDQAVQEFRAANNLIAVGGQLISELQLVELNSQLSVARGDVARAGARLDRIRAVLAEDKTQNAAQSDDLFETLIAEASGSTPATDIHTQYIEASRREAEIVAQFGADHERAAQYRAEKASLRQQVIAELARIAEGYESEYQVAKSRLEEITRSVDSLLTVAAGANDKMVKLRELEQTADTYKGLYRSFLERYQQTVQQQSFPMSDARIVAPALPPMHPSHPKTIPVILLSALMGGIVGGVYGVLREYRDGSFRARSQVRDEIGLKCLGMLPTISPYRPSKRKFRDLWREIAPVKRQEDLPLHIQYAVKRPRSIFAESLKLIAASTDHECAAQGSKIIGVLSVKAKEGKSLVAANLAGLLASEGARTLLVDADLRDSNISKLLAPEAQIDLLDVLTGSQPWSAAVCHVSQSDMLLIPASSRSGHGGSNLIFMQDRLRETLQDASKSFDYVIVDLPRLGAGGNANLLAGAVDCILLVIEWGRTPRDLVKGMLASNETVANRCAGVILNRVDLKRLRLYEDHYDNDEDALRA